MLNLSVTTNALNNFYLKNKNTQYSGKFLTLASFVLITLPNLVSSENLVNVLFTVVFPDQSGTF